MTDIYSYSPSPDDLIDKVKPKEVFHVQEEDPFPEFETQTIDERILRVVAGAREDYRNMHGIGTPYVSEITSFEQFAERIERGFRAELAGYEIDNYD